MSIVLLLAVAVAGGIGSGLRWTADALLSRVVAAGFPWAILVVNVSGSFALGMLTGASLGSPWPAVIGTGLLGGYTTFSTVSADSAVLWREGRAREALANVLGTFALCVLAAAAGLAAGAVLSA
ncbi:CrcB family protein [Microbacterium betulae]|uniref:Fluoride-specific ion channel FluC n=1 Tax=Microbacterium betulae TaxID=2981139 RepID=A0AA97FJI1_9MICO|nr:CrcB family protein [Microbacterium sp. AB]WOF22687.1 CrcB family protein [Microbacterium sp. AB]